MPTAEARVRTDRPSRYLVQLCRHVDQMGGVPHRPPTQHGGGQGAPEVQHVHYSDTHGSVRFAEGRCTLEATEGTLALRVEARDEVTLRRLEDGIAARLEKIGRRDQLAVSWQQSPASTTTPRGDAGRAAPTHHPGARKRRRHGRLGTIALAAGGAFLIAVHLGVGGGAIAASAWTSWAADTVLALVALKVAVVAGHIVLGRLAIRRGKTIRARRKQR